MSTDSCRTSYPTVALIGYWLGELDGPAESEFEEHLFACSECAARLRSFAHLGEGIRRATRSGHFHAVLPAPFIGRLKQAGLSVREYRLQPGGSVMCTVTPEDDLVVAHLHAPLHDVQRLDLVVHDQTTGMSQRLQDVAFDSTADEVVMVPNVSQLRPIVSTTQRVQLFAVESAGERALGEYTFNHSR
jgi:Putative zinc-finger